MIFKDININELFQLMQLYDIAETTLQNGKTSVVVKRNKDVIINSGAIIDRSNENIPAQGAPGTGLKPGQAAKKDTLEEPGPATPPPANEESEEKVHLIRAPLVGTFYRSPSPGTNAFVEAGDRVEAGDVVCIIEAMKSMNEILSEVKGVVKEICVENAKMVEFDQVLFKIDTGGTVGPGPMKD